MMTWAWYIYCILYILPAYACFLTSELFTAFWSSSHDCHLVFFLNLVQSHGTMSMPKIMHLRFCFMRNCSAIFLFYFIILYLIVLPLMIQFRTYSNVKKPSCFYPIPQAADCILRVVERANAPVIYLSTDAAESETDLLQSLVVLNNRPVPLVKRPARNSAEKWDALLYRHGIEGDSQVRWQCFSCGFELQWDNYDPPQFTNPYLVLDCSKKFRTVKTTYIYSSCFPFFVIFVLHLLDKFSVFLLVTKVEYYPKLQDPLWFLY